MLRQAVDQHSGHLAVEQADAHERVPCCLRPLLLTHNLAPPCPCRMFCQEQQAPAPMIAKRLMQCCYRLVPLMPQAESCHMPIVGVRLLLVSEA